jgi:hypothetical protein
VSSPPTELIELLRRDGPESASGLARRLGVSTPTVTRALARLGSKVVSIGRGRSSAYALRRAIRDIGDQWPLHRIGADGSIEQLGVLESLHGRYRWRLVPAHELPLFMRGEFADGLYEYLPWFLQALRPQGYLGREVWSFFAPKIGAPDDIRLWQDDDILTGLVRFGMDIPGNLAVGKRASEQATLFEIISNQVAVPSFDRLKAYTASAEKTDQTHRPASSAAGERPKFTCQIAESDESKRTAIVKFASLIKGNPTTQRWADLLICEMLASSVLDEHQISTADTEILDGPRWRFLQSTRFDRTPQGGRIGVFALDALDMAYVGSDQRNWLSGAEPLHAQGLINDDDLESVRLLDAFGRCIGNDDMHHGNLSFFAEPEDTRLRLAPVYDMLPMHYRPSPIGLVRDAPFVLPTPETERFPMWQQVAMMAEAYWSHAADDRRLSTAFSTICRDNTVRLRSWRRQHKL